MEWNVSAFTINLSMCQECSIETLMLKKRNRYINAGEHSQILWASDKWKCQLLACGITQLQILWHMKNPLPVMFSKSKWIMQLWHFQRSTTNGGTQFQPTRHMGSTQFTQSPLYMSLCYQLLHQEFPLQIPPQKPSQATLCLAVKPKILKACWSCHLHETDIGQIQPQCYKVQGMEKLHNW
jgi:hypothetical protein